MAPSQLKQLKASLRESGITGSQQSKKQRKKAAQAGRDQDKLARRNIALQGIREKFNPFEIQAPSRPKKFETTTSKTLNGQAAKGVHGRPGVTKGLGEERVRSI
jgi:nucleolar protein 14